MPTRSYESMRAHGFTLVFVWLLLGSLTPAPQVRGQTSWSVTAVGNTTYRFNSASNNPTLTLSRGVTYVFNLSVGALHPFWIKTNISAGTGNLYTNGVSNNGQISGPLTFAVPADAPGQLFYNCQNHSLAPNNMHGTINIVSPPAPPPPSGLIVLISLTPTGVTMKSIGATNWKAIPEFKSNLLSQTWTSVPTFTNTLADGTNTTTFDRLDAICGPDVFLRIRNTFP